MSIDWQGVFPAVTTQFRADYSLDLKATARHYEALIDSGVSGLIVCGSLGENQTLTPEEKRRIVQLAVEVSAGRAAVVSGVAECGTRQACEYVRDAQAMGADGFMVMPAMIYRADEREAEAHFRAVAAATKRPWMLYNNPVSYPVDVTPQMFQRLSNLRNLRAVKESSGDPRRITQLRLAVGDRYALFVGVDDLILEAAVLGIEGWVAGSGIAFPKENQHFWELTRRGQWDEARRMYRWLTPLLKLDVHAKFVQYIKLAVQEAGLGSERVRPPRMPLVGAERREVLRIIRRGLADRPRLGARKS
jgi:4-hydroxy-tetrahydrodipicolinate synthase